MNKFLKILKDVFVKDIPLKLLALLVAALTVVLINL